MLLALELRGHMEETDSTPDIDCPVEEVLVIVHLLLGDIQLGETDRLLVQSGSQRVGLVTTDHDHVDEIRAIGSLGSSLDQGVTSLL